MTVIPDLVRTPDALKAAREALGLSTDSLAKMLRVADGRVVRKWEAREHEIPGPVIVVMEAAMSYLRKRNDIAVQLESLRSGTMRVGSSDGEKADLKYVAALSVLRAVDADLETLTRRPSADRPSSAVHWYSLWRKTPDHSDPSVKNEWSVPTELSPEAALAYFEKHEGFSDGLSLCDEDDPASEFILEARVVVRRHSRNTQMLSAGPVQAQFHVKGRS